MSPFSDVPGQKVRWRGAWPIKDRGSPLLRWVASVGHVKGSVPGSPAGVRVHIVGFVPYARPPTCYGSGGAGRSRRWCGLGPGCGPVVIGLLAERAAVLHGCVAPRRGLCATVTVGGTRPASPEVARVVRRPIPAAAGVVRACRARVVGPGVPVVSPPVAPAGRAARCRAMRYRRLGQGTVIMASCPPHGGGCFAPRTVPRGAVKCPSWGRRRAALVHDAQRAHSLLLRALGLLS